MKQELLKLLQSLLRGELNRARRRKGRSPWAIGGLAVAVVAVSYFLHEPKAPSSATAKGAELICTVKSVYDGDTLTAEETRAYLRSIGWGEDQIDRALRPIPAPDPDAS